jgi:opacity protein-like surface antigen
MEESMRGIDWKRGPISGVVWHRIPLGGLLRPIRELVDGPLRSLSTRYSSLTVGSALALLVVISFAPTAGGAQESEQTRRESNQISVAGGVGFLESIDTTGGGAQFLLQFDGLYHFTRNFAAGVTLQAGPSSRSSTVAMSFDARYFFARENDEGLGRLVPYVGAGIGFRSYTDDTSRSPFVIPGSTDFLFSPTIGLEYDLTDHLSLTSDMRFNVTSGFDNFYYSWQLLGVRFRF